MPVAGLFDPELFSTAISLIMTLRVCGRCEDRSIVRINGRISTEHERMDSYNCS
jgi:hypothetical protein